VREHDLDVDVGDMDAHQLRRVVRVHLAVSLLLLRIGRWASPAQDGAKGRGGEERDETRFRGGASGLEGSPGLRMSSFGGFGAWRMSTRTVTGSIMYWTCEPGEYRCLPQGTHNVSTPSTGASPCGPAPSCSGWTLREEPHRGSRLVPYECTPSTHRGAS
jgi:hypothetical protein